MGTLETIGIVLAIVAACVLLLPWVLLMLYFLFYEGWKMVFTLAGEVWDRWHRKRKI